MDFVDMQIVKISSKAVIPTRATKYSVGLDFYSPSDYLIHPLSQIQIPTQIKIKVPWTLWQTSLQIWFGYETSYTCWCRSHRC